MPACAIGMCPPRPATWRAAPAMLSSSVRSSGGELPRPSPSTALKRGCDDRRPSNALPIPPDEPITMAMPPAGSASPSAFPEPIFMSCTRPPVRRAPRVAKSLPSRSYRRWCSVGCRRRRRAARRVSPAPERRTDKQVLDLSGTIVATVGNRRIRIRDRDDAVGIMHADFRRRCPLGAGSSRPRHRHSGQCHPSSDNGGSCGRHKSSRPDGRPSR